MSALSVAAQPDQAAPSVMTRGEMEAEIARLQQVVRTLELAGNPYDRDTGFASRATFLDLAGQEVARARRYEQPLALATLEMAGWATFPERFGAEAAAGIVCGVAQICTTSTRFGIDVLGRIDPNRFAILLPETTREGGQEFLGRLREVVRLVPIEIDGKLVKPALHVKLRMLKDEHRGFNDLLATA